MTTKEISNLKESKTERYLRMFIEVLVILTILFTGIDNILWTIIAFLIIHYGWKYISRKIKER